MRLTFRRVAGTVTGSKYVVEHAGARTLVDCGVPGGEAATQTATRGAAMPAGAPGVRIHGDDVPILAEVAGIEELSSHADWSPHLSPPPPRCASMSSASSAVAGHGAAFAVEIAGSRQPPH